MLIPGAFLKHSAVLARGQGNLRMASGDCPLPPPVPFGQFFIASPVAGGETGHPANGI